MGGDAPPTKELAEMSLSGEAAQWARYSRRVLISTIIGRGDRGLGLVGQKIAVGGWVKTGREQGKGSFAFLELNDGSSPSNLQVLVDDAVAPLGQLIPTGTSVLVEGELKKAPEGTKQTVELKVEKVLEIGTVDPAKYPIPKTKLTLEFLRDRVHFRPRTNTVLVDDAVAPLGQLIPTGTSVLVEGELKKAPEGTKQTVELKVEKVLEIGTVDPAKYPIPKTKLTLEFLRDRVHFRPRTNTISAIARIRNALAYATHTFFQKNGFLYVHTPIITTSDCEGAGEMFQVTTLFSEAEKIEKELKKNPAPSEQDLEAARLSVKEKGEKVANLKANKSSKEKISSAVADLTKSKENLSSLEQRAKLKETLPQKDGKIDHSSDFFGRQAFLTVSGQLQVETFACALSSVYTFGPTFRAEHSHTSRHLAEFWMVEPEIAFADLQDDMNCAEDYVKFLCQWLLDNCLDDMQLMVKNYDKGAIDRLKLVATSPFERISYTEAIEHLKNVTEKKFENAVEWGVDLASEHERYLTEVIFKKPVIVYNYPKSIKAFYMRLNDDGKTVAAMDVLVPRVGELIGGSQREERYEVIERRIREMGLPLEPYDWYLDLRRYGTVKHSGFGLGFERMVLFATGLDNIRDVIPFPRYPGRADL